MNIDKYLYEIIDDYKNAGSEEEKSEIFKDFCTSIWGSKNKRRTYTRTVKFDVRSDLLKTEIGQIFNSWSEVDYISYKAITKDTDWCSLLRQKINNLYTRYFDKDVILNKEYMDLLRTPRRLYYRWINGEEMSAEELIDIIENSIHKASELKLVFHKQKMNSSWNEYKKVIESFLLKIFNRCKFLEDFELDGLTDEKINTTNKYIYNFYNEDRFYVKYFCDSLEGSMLDYQKEYYRLKRGRNKKYKNCKECGKLIEIKSKKDFSTKYCSECKTKKDLEKYARYNAKRKQKKITTELNSLT